MRDQLQKAREAGDWDGHDRLCSPAMIFDDRRRGIRLSGDRELYLANSRLLSARPSRTLLATTGERLALERVCWDGSDDDSPFEIELLQVWEVDADGCIVALILFDPDARRAARVEMIERSFQHVADLLPTAGIEAMRVFIIDHDLERLRARLPDDFFLDDHRRTGVGRIDGADAFIESLAALFGEAPDLLAETLYSVAAGPHGILEMARMFGTLAASGGAFESFYARLWIFAGDRLAGIEMYEPEDLDLARARFEQLAAAAAAQA
jgi:hypothetical protein